MGFLFELRWADWKPEFLDTTVICNPGHNGIWQNSKGNKGGIARVEMLFCKVLDICKCCRIHGR